MQQQSPFAPPAKKKKRTSNVSFVEALKGIGGSVTKSLKDDVIKGTGQEIFDSISGRFPGTSVKEQTQTINPQQVEQFQQQEDDQARERAKQERHRELIAKPIFDRHQEEIKQQIEGLRQELRALAKELAQVGSSMEKAIEEEIAHPGTYHVSFFEKLKKIMVVMRKQATESRNWLAMSSQRKHAKGAYWGNVKKSGTSYMLSGERTIATQTG